MGGVLRFVKFVAGLSFVSAIFAVFLPLVFYFYGLSIVDGRPVAPIDDISQRQTNVLWDEYQGEGDPRLSSLTPWHYYFIVACDLRAFPAILFESCNDKFPGIYPSNSVAQMYVNKNAVFKGDINRQISSTALTVWISRNWDINQLLSWLYLEESSISSDGLSDLNSYINTETGLFEANLISGV